MNLTAVYVVKNPKESIKILCCKKKALFKVSISISTVSTAPTITVLKKWKNYILTLKGSTFKNEAAPIVGSLFKWSCKYLRLAGLYHKNLYLKFYRPRRSCIRSELIQCLVNACSAACTWLSYWCVSLRMFCLHETIFKGLIFKYHNIVVSF